MSRLIGFVGTMLVLVGGCGVGGGSRFWFFWAILAGVGAAAISWVIPMSAFPWARPGVEVVCIADAWSTVFMRLMARIAEWFTGAQRPRKGTKYTVARTGIYHDRLYLCLAEFGAGDWFEARGFRPLIRKPQSEDIALFKRIASEQPMEGV